jgi:hypothetical protein
MLAMNRYPRQAAGAALALAAFTLMTVAPALACACCAETAHRYVRVETIKEKHRGELQQLRFAKEAKLRIGPDDDNPRMKELKEAGENLALEFSRGATERMTFTLRDDKGRSGTLAFRMPATISIFEVDPRGENTDTGLGPTLYKEWSLTSGAIGDGLFKAPVTRNTKLTLVLHGRGNACTSADQFTDWTLQVYGPPGKFTLYGKLDSAER